MRARSTRSLAALLSDASAVPHLDMTIASSQTVLRARPNSFDGCRLATLAAQQDGNKERVRGQQVPRMGLEEAQASLRECPDRPFVLEGAPLTAFAGLLH